MLLRGPAASSSLPLAAAVLFGSTNAAAANPAATPPFNTTWFRSFPAKLNLSVVAANGSGGGTTALRWEKPEHFSTIFSYLNKPLSLQKSGSKVTLAMRWRSSGENECPASCYSKGEYCQSKSCQESKCQSKSVNCLSGTGDFRIALLDTSHASGAPIAADNWCPTGVGYGDMTKCLTLSPFDKMRGYDFRIFPHLTADAKHEPGQVPCSIYR